MTDLVTLPIVAGGVGAGVETKQLQAKKTVQVTNLQGTMIVEASNDGGATWCQVASFSGATEDQRVTVACEQMRVDASQGSADAVQIVAEGGLIRSGALPAAPLSGPGASLDTSEFGCLTTIIVTGFDGGGSINIESSGDGVHWSTIASFQKSGCKTVDVSSLELRVNGNNATATVSVGSEEPAVTSITSPLDSIVFRPGAVGDDAPGGNVYTTWAEVMAAINQFAKNGLRYLQFDNTFAPVSPTGVAPGGWNPCFIPDLGVGPYNFQNVVWTDRKTNPGATMGVEIGDGVQFQQLKSLNFGVLDLIYNGTTPGTFPWDIPSAADPANAGIIFDGNAIKVYNTLVNAQPMINISGPVGFIVWRAANESMMGNNVELPAPVVTMPDNNALLIYQPNDVHSVFGNWLSGGASDRISVRLKSTGAAGKPDNQANTNMMFGARPGYFATDADYTAAGGSPLFLGTVLSPQIWFNADRAAIGATLDAAAEALQFGFRYPVDTNGNAVLATLPGGASTVRLGTGIKGFDVGGNVSVNAFTLRAQVGESINGNVEAGGGESDFAFGTDFGKWEVTLYAAGAWHAVAS